MNRMNKTVEEIS